MPPNGLLSTSNRLYVRRAAARQVRSRWYDYRCTKEPLSAAPIYKAENAASTAKARVPIFLYRPTTPEWAYHAVGHPLPVWTKTVPLAQSGRHGSWRIRVPGGRAVWSTALVYRIPS